MATEIIQEQDEIKPLTTRQKKFLKIQQEVQETNAADLPDMVGFTSPLLILAALPHKKPKDPTYFTRKTTKHEIVIEGHKYGIPFGVYPRLILIYLITQAVRTKSREISLGTTFSQFMIALGFNPRQKWTREELRKQLIKTVYCHITCDGYVLNKTEVHKTDPISSAELWWDIRNKNPNQGGLFESVVVLGEDFYNALFLSPIPVDMRVLKALKASSRALDIYIWLTYSYYILYKQKRDKVEIRWEDIYKQFGNTYKRTRKFKEEFLEQLDNVLQYYKNANLALTEEGIELIRSEPHVAIKDSKVKQLSTTVVK